MHDTRVKVLISGATLLRHAVYTMSPAGTCKRLVKPEGLMPAFDIGRPGRVEAGSSHQHIGSLQQTL